MKTRTLYKSLPKNLAPNGFKFKVGEWYKIDKPLRICGVGFHASENIIDAMGYVPAEVLAKVEVRGKSIKQDDKQCWSEMRLVKTYKWTKKDSVSLAIFAAELVLKNFEEKFPDDKRPRQAIEAAKKVLRSDTAKNRSAAESAESAARSAAWSAESAVRSARSAAWSARSAAWSAVRSARSAAWSAVRSARSAAESAESAAWSAVRSARSAVRSAESAAWSVGSSTLKRTEKTLHDWVIKRAKLDE